MQKKKQSRNYKRKLKHIRIKNKINWDKPRLNVFKSIRHFEAQLIDDTKQKTLVQSSTIKLKLTKPSTVDAAKKVGEDIGGKIKKLGIKQIIFDRSGYIYHGKVKAFVEAVREQGVKI